MLILTFSTTRKKSRMKRQYKIGQFVLWPSITYSDAFFCTRMHSPLHLITTLRLQVAYRWLKHITNNSSVNTLELPRSYRKQSHHMGYSTGDRWSPGDMSLLWHGQPLGSSRIKGHFIFCLWVVIILRQYHNYQRGRWIIEFVVSSRYIFLSRLNIDNALSPYYCLHQWWLL